MMIERSIQLVPAMILALIAGSTAVARGDGGGPLSLKYWAGFEGGNFDDGPWITFNGETPEPTGTPGSGDVAVFDLDFVYPPSVLGFQPAYALSIPTEVSLFGMAIGDIVAIPPASNPRPINLGPAGLRIGLAPDRGGTLFSPGVIRSQGPVVVGGPSTLANGRPALVLFSTSRLQAQQGVEIIPNGVIDGAGTIEADTRNSGRLIVFQDAAASLLIRGDYSQDRPGAGSPFGGVLETEIAGPSENNDLLVVQGHARLGGTLLVNLLDGYSPVPGQLDATLITATSLEGRFDLVFFSPALEASLRMRLNYPPATPPESARGEPDRSFQSVRVTAEPLPPQPDIGDGGDGAAPIPGRPTRAVTADVDGDGFVDVCAVIPADPVSSGATPGQLLVIRNLGVNPGGGWRGFADPVVITPDPNFDPVDIAAGDVDGNGTPDLVVLDRTGDPVAGGNPQFPAALRVFLNDGVGGFGLFPQSYNVGNDPRGVALGDFIEDPDGQLDAAVTSLDSVGDGQLVVLANFGTSLRAWGGFGNQTSTPLGDDNPGTVNPGGLDNPKDVDDIAVGSWGTPGPGGTAGQGNVNILINNNATADAVLRGTPVFRPLVRVPVGAEPRNIAVRDIDRDGDQDIVTSNFGDGTVSLVLNDLSGDRGTPGFTAQGLPIGPLPGPIAAFDFDSDTDADIAAVVADPVDLGTGSVIQVLRNDTPIPSPRGTPPPSGLVFSRGPRIDFDTNPLYLLPGDVDNDGDIDVIAFVEPDGAPQRLAVAFVNALCPTDLDGSGATDMSDLCDFLWLFGSEVEPGAAGDINRDGVIDTRDLIRFLGRFGLPCQ